MSKSSPQSKTVGMCRSCNSVFVSEIRADGSIRPIGVSEECTCGNGEFRPITETKTLE
ncbi:hypothetical protein [Natronolimnobius baerhuensis]|uniref:hypothetical protein n=1 Tax=Natronolimnobius baerhuensis TaxID=253108 RepID=UPI00159567CB|nr:hypothetical protein [Natronolimnobius baerhuensis]